MAFQAWKKLPEKIPSAFSLRQINFSNGIPAIYLSQKITRLSEIKIEASSKNF
jgi:hypothetical protein